MFECYRNTCQKYYCYLNTENCYLNDSAKQPHNSGDDGFMAIKLDTSKAYDKVEWPFLKSVMRRMGFKEKWISLVMTCNYCLLFHLKLLFHLNQWGT